MSDTPVEPKADDLPDPPDAPRPPNPALAALLAVRDAIQAVITFYWSRRAAIGQYLLDFVPLYQSHRMAQKEIRLYSYQRKANASFGDDGWRVQLPEWCVHCATTDCSRVRKLRHLEHLKWALALPLLTFLFSIPVALWRFNFWWVPVISILGFPLGRWLTKTIDVRIEYYCCAEHRDNKDLPKLRLFGDQLVIRTGHKSIRRKFLDHAKVENPTG